MIMPTLYDFKVLVAALWATHFDIVPPFVLNVFVLAVENRELGKYFKHHALQVARERLMHDEELSDLAAFAACTSPDAAPAGVEESVFFDYTTLVEQARADEVSWCRRMGTWTRDPRKDMLAEGPRAFSLRWDNTDKGDASRPA